MARILVVEDDFSNADVIKQMLEEEHFEVESINTPWLIAQSINHFPPDLILMDILLRTGDGRLFCNSLKENPDTWHIPMLLITAMLESEIPRVPCLPDAIMLKPFDYHKLTKTIKMLLQHSGEFRE
ncbi:hypothetical protein DHW03_16205 [Pedobacter yonginense]|uniref:Response regulatory domain-containing protein n=1 Tax=Pedobacter yonginense TaxID=651869 RepID=A0A317EM08_9SPHI|nr:response regulator [Pedobacter yonginense]PWS26326.1 hypothetical protein DHW03_16205 [Pedobacter yonginense]